MSNAVFLFVCFFIKKKKKKCVYIWRERKKSIEEDERWKAITIKAFWSAYCVCVSSWGCWKKNNKVQNSDRKKNTFPDIHIQFFKKKSEFRCCNLLFPSYFSLQTTTALRITDHFGVKLSSLSFWCSITFHFTRISICQVWQSEGEEWSVYRCKQHSALTRGSVWLARPAALPCSVTVSHSIWLFLQASSDRLRCLRLRPGAQVQAGSVGDGSCRTANTLLWYLG